MTNAIERSTMRKIYLRLLPLAVVSYLLAYIDRINVSFAGLRMRDDLNMPAAAVGFALGTFIGATRFSSCATPTTRRSAELRLHP
jgi:ACS family tartrate transporter-like MFS transporter